MAKTSPYEFSRLRLLIGNKPGASWGYRVLCS